MKLRSRSWNRDAGSGAWCLDLGLRIPRVWIGVLILRKVSDDGDEDS